MIHPTTVHHLRKKGAKVLRVSLGVFESRYTSRNEFNLASMPFQTLDSSLDMVLMVQKIKYSLSQVILPGDYYHSIPGPTSHAPSQTTQALKQDGEILVRTSLLQNSFSCNPRMRSQVTASIPICINGSVLVMYTFALVSAANLLLDPLRPVQADNKPHHCVIVIPSRCNLNIDAMLHLNYCKEFAGAEKTYVIPASRALEHRSAPTSGKEANKLPPALQLPHQHHVPSAARKWTTINEPVGILERKLMPRLTIYSTISGPAI